MSYDPWGAHITPILIEFTIPVQLAIIAYYFVQGMSKTNYNMHTTTRQNHIKLYNTVNNVFVLREKSQKLGILFHGFLLLLLFVVICKSTT